MPRHRIAPGQSLATAISARSQNDTAKVLEHYDRVGLWQPARPAPPVPRRMASATIVRCRNSTSADLTFGDVAGLSSLGVDTSQSFGELTRELTFDVTDVSSDNLTRYAVAVEPIKRGDFGPMAVAGAAAARVNIQDVDDTHAAATAGDSFLTSGTSGTALLLLRPFTTGTQLVPVLLGQSPSVIGTNGIKLFDGWWKSSNTPSSYVRPAGTAYIYFDQYAGSQSDNGIEVYPTSPAPSVGDPVLKFTQAGLYLLEFEGTVEDASSGPPTTQSVTTGSASAGTAHTHDVDCPVRHFLLPYLYAETRPSGGSWSFVRSVPYSEMVIATFQSSDTYSRIYTSWLLYGLSDDDELRLSVGLYCTTTTGTIGAVNGYSELTITRLSGSEPTTGVLY